MRSHIVVIAVLFSSFGAIQPSNLPDNTILAIEKCAIPSFQNEFREAKAVFTGRIISESKDGDTRIFEFAVNKYWKGSVRKKIKVGVYETMRYQAWLKVGDKYLIFAAGDEDGELSIERCSRSKEFNGASEDLKKLGKGKRPK